MRTDSAVVSLILFAPVLLLAQNAPAPVTIAQRLDTPQARVFVATLQPHAPVVSKAGHATHRVLIYMDDGAMTMKEGTGTTTNTFKRGDVRWRAASGPFRREHHRSSDPHSRDRSEGQARGTPSSNPARSGRRRSAALHGGIRKRLRPRAAREVRGPATRRAHEHILNRVVFYLNDQPMRRQTMCACREPRRTRRQMTRRSRRIGSRSDQVGDPDRVVECLHGTQDGRRRSNRHGRNPRVHRD